MYANTCFSWVASRAALWLCFIGLWSSHHHSHPWHSDPVFCVTALHYPRIHTSSLTLKPLLRSRHSCCASLVAWPLLSPYVCVCVCVIVQTCVPADQRGILGGALGNEQSYSLKRFNRRKFDRFTPLPPLRGHRIYSGQHCNICVAQLLSGTERVYLCSGHQSVHNSTFHL